MPWLTRVVTIHVEERLQFEELCCCLLRKLKY